MGNKLKKRSELPDKYKWKLEDIYSSDVIWEEKYEMLKNKVNDLEKYKNVVVETSNNLLRCLNEYSLIISVLNKLYFYVKMKSDENNKIIKYQEYSAKVLKDKEKFLNSSTFILTEISSADKDKFKKFIEENNDLKIYEKFINDILKQREHTLQKKEENILLMVNGLSDYTINTFNTINDMDIEFTEIKNEVGKYVKLSQLNYLQFMHNKNVSVRKEAFEACYSTYSKNKHVLSSLFIGNIKKNIFFSTARSYNSCLEGALNNDNLKPSIYKCLLNSVNSKFDIFNEYFDLKKSVLNLDSLKLYDLYLPIVSVPNSEISYESGIEIITKALKILGEDYEHKLNTAFNSRWIDVYKAENKSPSVCSCVAYDTHPYIFINYENTSSDILSLAYELGYTFHLHYINNSQNYIYSKIKVFDKISSIVNRLLLVDYMIKNNKDEEEKKYLLAYYVEEFINTIFRQVMFAEFEKIIYEVAEDKKNLSLDILSGLYLQLVKKYFGNNVIIDDIIKHEFLRLPFLYSSFSVYKKPIEFLIATSITKDLLTKNLSGENYIEFLKAGDSKCSVELLKDIGINIENMRFYERAFDFFKVYLTKLKNYY